MTASSEFKAQGSGQIAIFTFNLHYSVAPVPDFILQVA
jgi:hypothetical protein